MNTRPLRLLLISALLAVAGVFCLSNLTGCSAPSTRVVQVQTLKAVGQSAEATVALSAQLYQQGRITSAQARQVLDLYDSRFQPAFRFAVAAVNANLDSVASPDVLMLADQLAQLVLSFQNPR